MQKVLLGHETEAGYSSLPLGVGKPTVPHDEPFHISAVVGRGGIAVCGSGPTAMQKALPAHDSERELSTGPAISWPDPFMSDQSEGLLVAVTAEAGAPLTALHETHIKSAPTKGTSLRTASSFCPRTARWLTASQGMVIVDLSEGHGMRRDQATPRSPFALSGIRSRPYMGNRSYAQQPHNEPPARRFRMVRP
jgi:hypothetical protein